MRGLLQLTWLEIKIFMREPLGAIGTLLMPVVMYLGVGRIMRGSARAPQTPDTVAFLSSSLPILVSVFMAISAVISLVTIISIYREGGILKRLRATPLRPQTILSAHVLVKLLFTAMTLVLMLMAGRRYYPAGTNPPLFSFSIALLFSTFSILSIGFVVASLVRTARFAQPVSAVIFYPMIALSGLFLPIDVLPSGLQWAARFLPLTYVVSLLRGIWVGEAWTLHLWDVVALMLTCAFFTAVSSRVFRWE